MASQESYYPLQSLYLYLTDHCNLRCGHCWISPKIFNDQQIFIPLETLRRCILEAKSLGLQSVKLTGGEPLLYPELGELLRFLSSEELFVYIESNGILFDRKMVETFRTSKVEHISVSLDGASEELHDEIRGVKGSFQKTLQGLQILSDSGLNFQIIMTLQRKNREEIPGLVELSRKLGAGSLKINPLQPCGRAKQAFDRGDNLELDELIHLYRKVEEEWPPSHNLEIIFDLPIAFRSIEDIKSGGGNECRILNILGVLANGDFSICGIGQTMNELRMGNLHQDSIREVWKNNPVLKELREFLPKKLKGICRKCIFQFQCLGSCRANAYGLTKDLYAPYFLCQQLFDSGLFPASRYLD